MSFIVASCMEIVKDQGERATAGWTGFMGKEQGDSSKIH